jgi:hypothetical protein
LYLAGIPGQDSVRQTTTLLHESLEDAYTVYNPTSQTIYLSIPPTPKILSKTPPVKVGKKSSAADWTVALQWKDGPNDPIPASIICGYAASNSGPRLYALPPSFGSTEAAVLHNGQPYGHALERKMDAEMLSFPIQFSNQGEAAREIFYRIDDNVHLPEGLTASIFDPVANTFEPATGWKTVGLAKGAVAHRFVVVGSAGYQARFVAGFTPLSLALKRIFPNPCRTTLHISYTVPYSGIKELGFAVYSLTGRKVWELHPAGQIQPGAGAIDWNGRSPENKPVASGIYILRMQATTFTTGKPLVFEQRFTLLP